MIVALVASFLSAAVIAVVLAWRLDAAEHDIQKAIGYVGELQEQNRQLVAENERRAAECAALRLQIR